MLAARCAALRWRTAETFFAGMLTTGWHARSCGRRGRLDTPVDPAAGPHRGASQGLPARGPGQGRRWAGPGDPRRRIGGGVRPDHDGVAACRGLFAAGEVLDVDGRCGGFNLHWAWASGIVAGERGAFGRRRGAGARGSRVIQVRNFALPFRRAHLRPERAQSAPPPSAWASTPVGSSRSACSSARSTPSQEQRPLRGDPRRDARQRPARTRRRSCAGVADDDVFIAAASRCQPARLASRPRPCVPSSSAPALRGSSRRSSWRARARGRSCSSGRSRGLSASAR